MAVKRIEQNWRLVLSFPDAFTAKTLVPPREKLCFLPENSFTFGKNAFEDETFMAEITE